MTVLLDEDVPQSLGRRLFGHSVETVASRGWRGIKNGNLLRLIAQASFDVFITADKNMEYQQHIEQYPFALVVLSTNHWPTIRRNTQPVRDAFSALKPGAMTPVDCGHFTPKKGRKTASQLE